MSMIALVDLTTWFWLLYCSLCTFLFMSRKCLNMSVLSTVQPFGYLLMKYSLSPESGSALLQPLGIRAARGLLRWADCYCDELLSLLILTRAWLSPRHFPVWLLMPGPSAEYAWATPGLSSCPFDVFRVIPQPKPGTATVAFASSPIVWEGPRTSVISSAVPCSTWAKAVCRQHSEFGGMSDIKPCLLSGSFTLLEPPGCGGAAAQIMVDSHCR